MTKQEFEGKLQIDKALKSVGLIDIDNDEYDEDEPIQEGEEPRHYPDDPMDLAKNDYLDKFQKGWY